MTRPHVLTGLEYAASLRQLADWYEAHPDVPTPYLAPRLQFFPGDKETTAAILKAAGGHWDKRALGGLMYFTSDIAGFRFEVVIGQDAVCRKRVVGYRQIPAREAETVEVIEWDCDPVLAP